MAAPINNFVPFIEYQFLTTADRLAYAFVGTDIGRCVIKDFENGGTYACIAAGTGVATMKSYGVSSSKAVSIELHSFRECDANSDVGNIAANGGILASDTTPIMRGRATTNNQEISWATGNVDPILCEVALPYDVDGTQDVTLELVINSGSTDAATMAIATSWDGGSEVTDSASDSATKSATDHTITGTIDKADVPDSPKHVTIRLTPPTHGSNAIQLSGVRLIYVPK